jgi:hypothetical protein
LHTERQATRAQNEQYITGVNALLTDPRMYAIEADTNTGGDAASLTHKQGYVYLKSYVQLRAHMCTCVLQSIGADDPMATRVFVRTGLMHYGARCAHVVSADDIL